MPADYTLLITETVSASDAGHTVARPLEAVALCLVAEQQEIIAEAPRQSLLAR